MPVREMTEQGHESYGQGGAGADLDEGETAALREWMQLSDALLRGLVHSLNNRITALSAVGELAEMGEHDLATAAMVPGELGRMRQLASLFRLLVSDEAPPSAIEVGPVVDDALAMHTHHTRLRTVQCDLMRTDAGIPVRAPRWALFRLLLVLVEEGKRSAEREGLDRTMLRLSGDEQWLELQVDGAELTPYAAAMARLCGADAAVGDAVARIPTLLEVRRLERLRRTV